MRLHLDDQVRRLCMRRVVMRRSISKESLYRVTLCNRGIITVGRQHIVRTGIIGSPDHFKQAVILRLAINNPVGVENLVATVLGVCLGKHHQLYVDRVSAQCGKTFYQVIYLVIG